MKIFEGHIHHMLSKNKVSVRESVRLYQKQFKMHNVVKACFLAFPTHARPERDNLPAITLKECDRVDNTKAMYFKSVFSPNGYAYAGLEYDKVDLTDKKATAEELLRQVTEYKRVGFDGIKMNEGNPNTRAVLDCPLDDEIFDLFYEFCEREGFPIIMHLTNNPDMWDLTKIRPNWLALGRYYDERFPSFDQMQEEVMRVLEKFPKLKFTLAHFGFLTFAPKSRLEKFISYENTMLDVTPGGDNYFNILDDKEYWIPFIKKHIDRFVYGSDMYNTNFSNSNYYENSLQNRANLVKRFFSTTDEYEYTKKNYRGIGLEKDMLEKLFHDNLYNLLKEPNAVDYDYFINKCDELIKDFEPWHIENLNLFSMKNDFISLRDKGYIEFFKED